MYALFGIVLLSIPLLVSVLLWTSVSSKLRFKIVSTVLLVFLFIMIIFHADSTMKETELLLEYNRQAQEKNQELEEGVMDAFNIMKGHADCIETFSNTKPLDMYLLLQCEKKFLDNTKERLSLE